MASDKLTIKQEKYAQNLFTGMSQREAYKDAYDCSNCTDKSVDENASRLAADIKVISRIEKLTNDLVERNMVTKENVLTELSHIAFDDVRNYLRFYTDADGNVKTEIKDSNTIDTRAISEVSQGKDGQFKFKVYCKDNALFQLGKHLGMFVDKSEVKADINGKLEMLDDTKIEQLMAKATEDELEILARADAIMKELEKR